MSCTLIKHKGITKVRIPRNCDMNDSIVSDIEALLMKQSWNLFLEKQLIYNILLNICNVHIAWMYWKVINNNDFYKVFPMTVTCWCVHLKIIQ